MEIHGMKSFFNLIIFAVCLFILLSAIGLMRSYNGKHKMAETTHDAEFRNKRYIENDTNIKNSTNLDLQVVKSAVPNSISKHVNKNNLSNIDLHKENIRKVRDAKAHSDINNVQTGDIILKNLRKGLHGTHIQLRTDENTSVPMKSGAIKSGSKPRLSDTRINKKPTLKTAVKSVKKDFVISVNKSRMPLKPVNRHPATKDTDRQSISQLERKVKNHDGGGRKRVRTDIVGLNSEKSHRRFDRKNKKRWVVTTLGYRDKTITSRPNSDTSHSSSGKENDSLSKFTQNKIVTKSDITDSSAVTLTTTSIIGHQDSYLNRKSYKFQSHENFEFKIHS